MPKLPEIDLEKQKEAIMKAAGDVTEKVKGAAGDVSDMVKGAAGVVSEKVGETIDDLDFSFNKQDDFRDAFMLKGALAKEGYDWWWHSFTGQNEETGEEEIVTRVSYEKDLSTWKSTAVKRLRESFIDMSPLLKKAGVTYRSIGFSKLK